MSTNTAMSCLPTDSSGKRTSQRSEEHTSELQSLTNLVCRLLLEKKKKNRYTTTEVPTSSPERVGLRSVCVCAVIPESVSMSVSIAIASRLIACWRTQLSLQVLWQ